MNQQDSFSLARVQTSVSPGVANGAASRLSWLDQLTAALDEAHRLSGLFGAVSGRSAEAIELRGRIRPVRAEIQEFRGRAGSGVATMPAVPD